MHDVWFSHDDVICFPWSIVYCILAQGKGRESPDTCTTPLLARVSCMRCWICLCPCVYACVLVCVSRFPLATTGLNVLLGLISPAPTLLSQRAAHSGCLDVNERTPTHPTAQLSTEEYMMQKSHRLIWQLGIL